jgi:hypothetical protein
MRTWAIGVCGIVAIGLCGIGAFAQREKGAERVRDTPAPTDKAVSWTMAEMKSVNQELAASKQTTNLFFG